MNRRGRDKEVVKDAEGVKEQPAGNAAIRTKQKQSSRESVKNKVNHGKLKTGK